MGKGFVTIKDKMKKTIPLVEQMLSGLLKLFVKSSILLVIDDTLFVFDLDDGSRKKS